MSPRLHGVPGPAEEHARRLPDLERHRRLRRERNRDARRDELATKAEDRANLEAWQKERDRLHEEARADREAWQSGGVLCPRTRRGCSTCQGEGLPFPSASPRRASRNPGRRQARASLRSAGCRYARIFFPGDFLFFGGLPPTPPDGRGRAKRPCSRDCSMTGAIAKGQPRACWPVRDCNSTWPVSSLPKVLAGGQRVPFRSPS